MEGCHITHPSVYEAKDISVTLKHNISFVELVSKAISTFHHPSTPPNADLPTAWDDFPHLSLPHPLTYPNIHPPSMSSSPDKPPQTPLDKEDPPYLSPTYLTPTPGFIDPQRQASRTSAIASLAGGLPVDPEDPAPPKESLRGCAVLAGCVLIACELGFRGGLV